MQKYNIKFQNLYNINKKKFLINIYNIKRCIIFKKILVKKKLFNII